MPDAEDMDDDNDGVPDSVDPDSKMMANDLDGDGMYGSRLACRLFGLSLICFADLEVNLECETEWNLNREHV